MLSLSEAAGLTPAAALRSLRALAEYGLLEVERDSSGDVAVVGGAVSLKFPHGWDSVKYLEVAASWAPGSCCPDCGAVFKRRGTRHAEPANSFKQAGYG